jgi:hypothetical protein
LQYHSSNLAPTGRYDELASLDSAYAGRGPTLFTDFDEYALYELRDLDVGGPNFVYPPPALAGIAGGYGKPVQLDRAPPAALARYPLIVTRRDPSAGRPPSAYRLLRSGSYYEVWGRRPGELAALVHTRLDGPPALDCPLIGRLAVTQPRGTRLIAAPAPPIVSVSLAASRHPARWGHERQGLVMSTPGTLSAGFRLPAAGRWQLWAQGQFMPSVALALDGRRLATIKGQLSGNSLVPDTVGPFTVQLSAGGHQLAVTRRASTLAPGDGGSAVLDAVFLTPSGFGPGRALADVSASNWPSLCGGRYEWIELLGA